MSTVKEKPQVLGSLEERIWQILLDPKIKIDLHNRDLYGKGEAGRQAFMMMETEPVCHHCQVFLTQRNPDLIPAKACVVLGFDVSGDLSQYPLCLDCLPKAQEIITKDLKQYRQVPSFGINGWGRA